MKRRERCFPGDRPRQQRFTCSRRTHQQNAFGDAPAELLKFLRLPQELNDFLEFFLGFFDARHIFECYFLLLAGEKPGPALPEREGLVAAALHLAHEEYPEAQQ